MPDFRPAAILVIYLLIMSAIWVFAGYDNTAPITPGTKLSTLQAEPRISIQVSSSNTATVEETMTYEIRVSVETTNTTATTVAVSDTMNFLGGALLDVLDADPSFESTESVYGGGLKINWGSFQLVGGEELSIRLNVKLKNKGTVVNFASVKIEGGETINSNDMTISVLPPKELTPTIESTSTTTTAFNLGFLFGKGLINSGSIRSLNSTLLPGSDITGRNVTTTSKGASPTQSAPRKGALSSNPGRGSSRSTTKTTPKDTAKNTTTTMGPVSSSTSSTEVGVMFSDVKRGDWFELYAGDLINWDIIEGYPDNTFKPNALVNRAEFTALVVRCAGPIKPSTEPFVDVEKSDWFYPVVASAYNLGLINGISEDRFAPLDKLTREQAAVISIKLAGLPVDTGSSEINGWLQGFVDRDKIAEWARPAVAASIKYNLMNGYPSNTLNPTGSITRAEASALIHRLVLHVTGVSRLR
ncbi:MAG TPA: S-layer homology domain-containing protein [Anaerolineae bacterium]|jgi:hypothetical protein|nr:S-layer homology domain-containing protein [Anaerolineae bacterium]